MGVIGRFLDAIHQHPQAVQIEDSLLTNRFTTGVYQNKEGTGRCLVGAVAYGLVGTRAFHVHPNPYIAARLTIQDRLHREFPGHKMLPCTIGPFPRCGVIELVFDDLCAARRGQERSERLARIGGLIRNRILRNRARDALRSVPQLETIGL